MKSLVRILKFGYPLRYYVPEYIIYTIGYTVFGLVNFVMLIPLLDIIFGINLNESSIADPTFEFSVTYLLNKFEFMLFNIVQEYGKMSALFFVGAIMLGFNLFANLFRYLSFRTVLRFRINIIRRIRDALYNKLISQPMSYHLKKRRGELLSTAFQESGEVEGSLVNALRSLVAEPIVIVVYFSYLFYISFELTLVTILFLPVVGYFISRLIKKLRQTGEDNIKISQSFFSFWEETIGGIRLIQSHSAGKFFAIKHQQLNDALAHNNKKNQARKELSSPMSEFLGVVVVVIILIYGGYLVFQGNGSSGLSPSVFMSYLIIYSQTIGPIKSFSNSISAMQRGMIAAKNVLHMLDEQNAIVDKENAIEKKTFNHSIEFRGVSFDYHETPKALSNFNLVIQKGECIALVGASGSGKTTVSYLLNRFIDPSKGKVLIDGISLRDYKLDNLRSMIAYIPQEAILFHDSIVNNVAFGVNDIDLHKVKTSLEVAYATNFVNRLPNKEFSVVGEKGMTLSGGERQRITIARAVYKDAPILVMDEATSALDSESEQYVQKAINQLVQNRTSIIIAHRLSTIKTADRIIVMQKGEIVEEGSHKTLMKIKNGYYQNLVKIQQLT